MCSLEKELQIKRATTYHLGVLHRGFETRVFYENLMENVNETHFFVNLDNDRTLGFGGNTTVKYAKVVSRRDSITMVIRISRGRQSMIEALMFIFTNSGSNYPIRGLKDNILGIGDQKGGWMRLFLLSSLLN